MRSFTINCDDIASEAGFWSAYLTATEPEGSGIFGRNLDAFWDALNGGPGWPGECELRFINTGSLQSLREGRFLDALTEIAKTSTFVKVTLE